MLTHPQATARLEAEKASLEAARAAARTCELRVGAAETLEMWASARDAAAAGAKPAPEAVQRFCEAWSAYSEVHARRYSGDTVQATAREDMDAWDRVDAAVKGLFESAYGCRFEEAETSPQMQARWTLELTGGEEDLAAGVDLEVRSYEPEPDYLGRVRYVTVCDFGATVGFDGSVETQPAGVTDAGADWLQEHLGLDRGDVQPRVEPAGVGMEL